MMTRDDNKKEVYLGIEHFNKGRVVDLRRGVIGEWDLLWFDVQSSIRLNCGRWIDRGYRVLYVGKEVVLLIYNK
jgi:hypothetical protein